MKVNGIDYDSPELSVGDTVEIVYAISNPRFITGTFVKRDPAHWPGAPADAFVYTFNVDKADEAVFLNAPAHWLIGSIAISEPKLCGGLYHWRLTSAAKPPVASVSYHNGLICNRCNARNEYAGAEHMKDGKYVCFSCR